MEVPHEGAARIDRLATPFSSGPVREWLGGTPGHPLHPMLTDLPVGLWTSSWLLDLVGGRSARGASRRLLGLGVMAALPTAATGLSDWGQRHDQDPTRGNRHATCMALATVAFAASWWARRGGHRAVGLAMAQVGAAAATVGGLFGGQLAFGSDDSDGGGASADEPTTDRLMADMAAADVTNGERPLVDPSVRPRD